MKLHVLGLPHTVTSKEFATCAFTQKVVKLCAMMHRRGHHVVHYGVEGSSVECTEHVDIVSHETWAKDYAHPGTGYYDTDESKHAGYIAEWTVRAGAEIRKRAGEPHTELMCLAWGGAQREAVKGVPQFEIESGIGYEHSWADWRVYESYAWLHTHLGKAGLLSGAKWYWAVIPNAFDLTDFPVMDVPRQGFLYMGRLNDDKGVGLAIHAAREAGEKITIVGPGDPARFLAGNPHATYLPPVGVAKRAALLSGAKAVFCPSFYVEPFCGVHIEAQLCGTPVITTDWGVFAEGVIHGVTGYRCRTFEQFVWAARNVDRLDSDGSICRAWAAQNYSLERVALMYEEYFQSVLNVKHKGFYTEHPGRQQLDWLRKWTPAMPAVELDVPHVAPPVPAKLEGWAVDQNWEREWWGLNWAPNWDEEIRKQETYFRMIGLVPKSTRPHGSHWSPNAATYDFGAATVLDVGCGPVSVLQRSRHGPSRGVDPLAVSDETRRRYANNHVEFLNIKAEEMPVDKQFDEVLIYNCLQHTDDPHEILRRVVACARKTVRIFEWIDLGVCPGHPQNLTEDMFQRHFGGSEWDRPIWNVGVLKDFGGTAVNKYIAIHAVRR